MTRQGKILAGKIALVAGGSRGVGRGIARELGAAGAKVYVTGRSTREGGATDGVAGTVEGAAEAATAAGGRGVAVRCDHTVDGEVEALFARLRRELEREGGRLDILVNSVWGGYEEHFGSGREESYGEVGFGAPFWEQPLKRWHRMIDAGARAHFTAARLAAPLMLERGDRGPGLVVAISAGHGGRYMGNVIYDVAKTAIDRLGFALAQDLDARGVASVVIHPGFTRTERVEAEYTALPELAESHGELDTQTHSPRYVGRAVVALAADGERLMERSGKVFPVGRLALDYGFTDVDGRQPQWPPAEPA